jgi:hypothetical protein
MWGFLREGLEMSAWQKLAWFNLAVIISTVVLVVALIPVLGTTRAHGGVGLLGLLGLAPLFFRGRSVVLEDERDQMIRLRSGLIGFSIFWLAFVAGCMSLPALYGWDGSVPVGVVLSGVWYGVMVVVGVTAVATLVMYRLGSADAT